MFPLAQHHVTHSIHHHLKRASTGQAYTTRTINNLPAFKPFAIWGLRKTKVVCLAGNCLPCTHALHPRLPLYPYSFLMSADLLPHCFESDIFRLPLKALTSCTANAQSPSTLFISFMTSVDLSADLIKMNGQHHRVRVSAPLSLL